MGKRLVGVCKYCALGVLVMIGEYVREKETNGVSN